MNKKEWHWMSYYKPNNAKTMKDKKYIVIETEDTNENGWPRYEVHTNSIAVVTENISDYCEGQDFYSWIDNKDLKKIIEAQEELIMNQEVNKIKNK
tara:strand:+ start:94 stop:381 length:288 start_codon:yes stop_codon:yes gene_type:complete